MSYNHVGNITRAAEVLDKAFAAVPLQQVLMKKLRGISLDEKLDSCEGYFYVRLVALEGTGAEIIEADDYGLIAIWIRPGLVTESPNFGPEVEEFVNEFKTKMKSLKEEHGLIDRNDWHLNFIGRDPNNKKKGSIRKLLEPYLQKCRQEGTGASLAAISDHAFETYKHFGFKEVGRFTIGAGQVDNDGQANPNGAGLNIYYMIYD